MTDKRIAQHEAIGHLTVTAAHFVGGEGIADVMTLRWRDNAGVEGESSRAELANRIAGRRGRVVVGEGEAARSLEAVEVEGHRVLRTEGTEEGEADPLLELPRY